MFLGIEIGATKLQLGVGRGDGTPLVDSAAATSSRPPPRRASGGRSKPSPAA